MDLLKSNPIELQDILINIEETEDLFANYKQQLSEYKDGYKHILIVWIHRCKSIIKLNNLHQLILESNEFNGDNGTAYIYTTNPNTHLVKEGKWKINIVSKEEIRNVALDIDHKYSAEKE